MSNTMDNEKELPEGSTGRVEKIEDDGDAIIKFDSEQLGWHGIWTSNFDKLQAPPPQRDSSSSDPT